MSGDAMSVRRSSISDALDVLRLVEEYYDGVSVMARDSRETLMAYLTNADCGVWLAYCDATPVGCILYHPLPDMERTGEVKRLYGDSLHTECLERREQLRHLMSTTRRPARRLRRPDRPCVRCRVSRLVERARSPRLPGPVRPTGRVRTAARSWL